MNMKQAKLKAWLLIALIAVCGTVCTTSCSSSNNTPKGNNVSAIADKIWDFSQTHPDGFTIDARTLTEPSEGIAVSYAATQNSHAREQLDGKIAEISKRGTLLVGTTGDYRPLTYCEPSGDYWGFGIDLASEIAKTIGVNIKFVKTSWPTLSTDVMSDPQLFDFAIGGITITEDRRKTMQMSSGYLANGKTILCRASEKDKYKSLSDIDKPEVRVMVNPGGLNEKFAKQNLTNATIMVHQKNEEIPSLIAEGAADVMITEITEAPYYVTSDSRLAAPLLNTPFTNGEIGVLMRNGQEDLLQLVNAVIKRMKEDGSLRLLYEKYGLVYTY